MSNKSKTQKTIPDYDLSDSSIMINKKKKLRFEDIGLSLPANPPTQVVSIRLPTSLLNEIKAMGSQDDVPYQALIKILLSEGITLKKNKSKKSA